MEEAETEERGEKEKGNFIREGNIKMSANKWCFFIILENAETLPLPSLLRF